MKRDARHLRVLRAEQRITQSRVAAAARLSASRYWQIENGEGAEPSADERKAIASALNVEVADIAWPELLKVKAS